LGGETGEWTGEERSKHICKEFGKKEISAERLEPLWTRRARENCKMRELSCHVYYLIAYSVGKAQARKASCRKSNDV